MQCWEHTSPILKELSLQRETDKRRDHDVVSESDLRGATRVTHRRPGKGAVWSWRSGLSPPSAHFHLHSLVHFILLVFAHFADEEMSSERLKDS